jgi:hypothetical protein
MGVFFRTLGEQQKGGLTQSRDLYTQKNRHDEIIGKPIRLDKLSDYGISQYRKENCKT